MGHPQRKCKLCVSRQMSWAMQRTSKRFFIRFEQESSTYLHQKGIHTVSNGPRWEAELLTHPWAPDRAALVGHTSQQHCSSPAVSSLLSQALRESCSLGLTRGNHQKHRGSLSALQSLQPPTNFTANEMGHPASLCCQEADGQLPPLQRCTDQRGKEHLHPHAIFHPEHS